MARFKFLKPAKIEDGFVTLQLTAYLTNVPKVKMAGYGATLPLHSAHHLHLAPLVEPASGGVLLPDAQVELTAQWTDYLSEEVSPIQNLPRNLAESSLVSVYQHMGSILKGAVRKQKKAIFAVESQHRHPGDLGATILVLARNPVQALGIARRLYPEHTSIKGNHGRIFEVSHAFVDWDTGQTFITREKRRLPIKAVADGHAGK